MQATFSMTDSTGNTIEFTNITPLAIDNEWLTAVGSTLSQEEIERQMRNELLNEFMAISPLLMEQLRIQRDRMREINDPQGGAPKEMPKLKQCQFNRIESRRYHKTDKDEKFKQETCMICCEAFKSNNKIPILACGHDFHWKCLETWVTKHHNICPICKEEVKYPYPELD